MLDESIGNSGASSTISLRICQEGHANALALNKDCNQIAVAGRSLLKLYAIDSDGFTEVCNMRGGKNQNLSYSSNDVAWSTLDGNILATAATNGVVSVWDLSKFGRQKQLLIYNDHERTAHTVTFHSSEANLLISGSQDSTIKCFDIRCDKAIYTFYSNSESVRDVKFSPQCNNIFSAVSENGTVQLWDLRRGDKCLLQYTAHSGPIYTCDWHPINNWLATGSRDKQIKIWNMDGKASLEYTIHTIAVVGRVKWRPDFIYHIASCALVVDYSIHIWDIRRPYIPFASFNEHTNITTDISWRGNDSHSLLSTGKDSTIYKHSFKDATRPALKGNAYVASLSRKGDISFAYKRKIQQSLVITPHILKTNNLMPRNVKSANGIDQFHIAESNMCRFHMKFSYTGYIDTKNSIALKEHESFIGCAKELILHGQKLADLCEHNANVTRKYGKHKATTLWNFIKILYDSNDFNKQKYEDRNAFTTQKNPNSSRRSTGQVINSDTLIKWDPNEIKTVTDTLDDHDEFHSHDNNVDAVGGTNAKQIYPPYGSVILSESQILSEISFENFELLRNGFIYVGPPDFTLTFPDTALHCNVQEARPQHDMKVENREKSPSSDIPTILKVNHAPSVNIWEPHQFISDSLMMQNDVGDVQTVLSILITMGECRKYLPIGDDLVEHWFQTYIDQLHRYQLWNEACTVINLSWLSSVQQSNQKSTTVYINCGECGRPLVGNVGWYCQKCKSMDSSVCCVCGLVVRGLYAWCQGCSHGGHVEHLMEYFSNHSICPKCGHLCEYN